MKKNILIYGLSAFLCMSCSNYLDIKPYGKTIPKTAEEFSASAQAPQCGDVHLQALP